MKEHRKDIPKDFLKAIHIAEKVFHHLSDFVRPGITEKELAKKIRKAIKFYGGKKESFRIIIASGKRSSMIHGFATDKVIRSGEIIMFDLGALYNGYRSDLTRTYVLAEPTKQQKKVHDILLKAQDAAYKKIKAGVRCCDVDGAARDLITKAGYGKYFRHSLGHGIRFKTHESPRINARNRRKLKEGDIITIEPGIYLNNWGGMRVEDMV